MKAPHPTPYADVNPVLLELLSGVQTILGRRFIGLYLFGSLASGDFDRDSDVDFIVVSENEISPDLFSALQAMHARIATIDSWCATQLDGSYISHQALRRYDPTNAVHPHIDRGVGESLRMMQHESDWIIQRHGLREQGLVVAGPAPHTLIDPVLSRELRQAALDMLHGWLAPMIDDPAPLKSRRTRQNSMTQNKVTPWRLKVRTGSGSDRVVAQAQAFVFSTKASIFCD